MNPGVLDGIRVVAVGTGPASLQATTVLADFGAQVTVVEPPAGDPFRAHAAAPFWFRGKQAVTLDLESEQGRSTARELAIAADVLVAAGPPDRIERWGLGPTSLNDAAPHLVQCSITGFGPHGSDADLPGYEGLVAARAGRMAAFDVQLRRDRPVFAAVQVATHLASQAAVQGIVAALMQRERTGRGAVVETSLLQSLMAFDLVDMLSQQLHERDARSYTPLRLANPMPTLNYHPLRTADGGWIQCGNLLEHLFVSFLDAVDLLGELLIDDRFQGSPAAWEPEAIEHARDLILERMQERTTAEWMAIFDDNGNVAAEPIITTEQALDHRDIAGALVGVDDPNAGPTTQIGPIAHLSATPAAIPAHSPSAEPDRIGPTPISRDMRETNAPGRPLAGVTVLDLSTIIAGPLGASLLADLGARVIKVEPYSGDPFRQMLIEGRMAVKTNAGKESICIDLKTEAGRGLIHRMVADADVLMHNFRGPVPAKLGIDPKTLHAINPDLIWAVINGYRADSPSALRPATHPVMGASTGGVAWQAGTAITRDCPTLADVRETSRQIMAANEANPDPNTSVVAASAILLALLARERHAEVRGQLVRIDMQTANAWANGDDFLRYPGKAPRPQVDADHRGLAALYRLYECAEGWVFLAAPTDARFEHLCAVAGWDLHDDERFATASARADNDDALATELAARFSNDTADAWEATLAPAGVGCVRADGIDVGTYWASDPNVIANGWAPEVEHARFGRLRRWGPLATVGGPNPDYGAAPLAGEHTDTLLAELGCSPDEIAALRADRVVNSEPVEVAKP